MLAMLNLTLGVVILIAGGEILSRGLGLATRSWRGPWRLLGASLIIMSQATPELALGLEAGLTGKALIALGAVAGSCAVNLLLTPGLLLLLHPRQEPARGHPERAIAAALLALIVFNVSLRVTEQVLSWPAGLIFLAVLLGMAILAWRSTNATERPDGDLSSNTKNSLKNISWVCIPFMLVGAAVTAWGAQILMTQTSALGHSWGLSPVLAGWLLLGPAIALPETLAALLAARRHDADGMIRDLGISSLVSVLGVGAIVALTGVTVIPDQLLLLNTATLCLSLILAYSLVLKQPLSRLHGGMLLAGFITTSVLAVLLTV